MKCCFWSTLMCFYPSPYANDTTILVKREDDNLWNMVNLLKLNLLISGLEINQSYKSQRKKPSQTKDFRQKWPNDGDLSKLLRVPFEFNLDVKEVDKFLEEKLCKKLKYQSTLQLPLAIRAMVINYVLVFTPWLLINVLKTQKSMNICKTSL